MIEQQTIQQNEEQAGTEGQGQEQNQGQGQADQSQQEENNTGFHDFSELSDDYIAPPPEENNGSEEGAGSEEGQSQEGQSQEGQSQEGSNEDGDANADELIADEDLFAPGENQEGSARKSRGSLQKDVRTSYRQSKEQIFKIKETSREGC